MTKEHKWQIKKYKNLQVYYLATLDGGGMTLEQDCINLVKNLFGQVNSLYEFGCGPGFIGFSPLANGLCKRLCLTDVNPLAIAACNKTIKANGLEGKVKAYISDVLKNVPTQEKWNTKGI